MLLTEHCWGPGQCWCRVWRGCAQPMCMKSRLTVTTSIRGNAQCWLRTCRSSTTTGCHSLTLPWSVRCNELRDQDHGGCNHAMPLGASPQPVHDGLRAHLAKRAACCKGSIQLCTDCRNMMQPTVAQKDHEGSIHISHGTGRDGSEYRADRRKTSSVAWSTLCPAPRTM